MMLVNTCEKKHCSVLASNKDLTNAMFGKDILTLSRGSVYCKPHLGAIMFAGCLPHDLLNGTLMAWIKVEWSELVLLNVL